MRKIACYNQLHPSPIDCEKHSGDTETIPDQSLSVREILDRFTKGLGVPGGKVPMYYGEEVEYPNFDRMDISERHDWVRDSKQFVDDTYKLANEKPKEKSDAPPPTNIS